MQYRPSASDLLATIAELIDDELLPALPAALQHKARVAANLARILEREARLAPAALERERDVLAALLDDDHDGGDGASVETLQLELVTRLRADAPAELEAAAWEALVAVARDDLAIAKPGHDSWEGQ